MKMRILAVVAAILVPCFSGCSSFSRQWRAATKEPTPASIAGPWEGSWISEKSGHKDKLRCVITLAETNRYNAFFHAKYRKVFSFSYTVPLIVQQAGTNFTFSGEADLGKLAGGVYTYEGTATPANYQSTYKSKYDFGRFEMTRPVPK